MPADPKGTPRALLVAILLAAATVFFVWGSFAERSGHHDGGAGAVRSHSEGGETAEQHVSEGGTETRGEAEFRPLGIDLESAPLVVIAAVISFGLAALVALHPGRAVLLVTAVVALGFAMLETVEVIHQIDVGNAGLTVLALTAGILHAAAGIAITAALPVTGTASPAPAS